MPRESQCCGSCNYYYITAKMLKDGDLGECIWRETHVAPECMNNHVFTVDVEDGQLCTTWIPIRKRFSDNVLEVLFPNINLRNSSVDIEAGISDNGS